MNVLEALKSRSSTRAFQPKPVSRQTLENILQAATRSPSWGNSQPWEIFVAGGESLERLRQASLANMRNRVPQNPDLPRPQEWPEAMQQRIAGVASERLKLMDASGLFADSKQAVLEQNHRLFGAPAVAYLCLERGLTPWSILDCGMLAQSIMLAAREYGVDSMPAFMLVIYPDLIRAELNVPANLLILFAVALGYRDPQHPLNQFHSTRRPLGEVAHFKSL